MSRLRRRVPAEVGFDGSSALQPSAIAWSAQPSKFNFYPELFPILQLQLNGIVID